MTAVTSPEEVTAVVVTYGDRGTLLLPLVSSLRRERVGRLILVDNASAPSTVQLIGDLSLRFGRWLEVVRLESNVGSALGFSAGIDRARSYRDARFLWMLDDDCVPEAGSLEPLLDSISKCEELTALCSYRPAREYQRLLVSTGSQVLAYPPRSSVMGFDVVHWIRSRTTSSRRRKDNARNSPTYEMLYGPWGGLFLPRAAIGIADWSPDEWILYADDTAFTWQLRRAGVRLALEPRSKIQGS